MCDNAGPNYINSDLYYSIGHPTGNTVITITTTSVTSGNCAAVAQDFTGMASVSVDGNTIAGTTVVSVGVQMRR